MHKELIGKRLTETTSKLAMCYTAIDSLKELRQDARYNSLRSLQVYIEEMLAEELENYDCKRPPRNKKDFTTRKVRKGREESYSELVNEWEGLLFSRNLADIVASKTGFSKRLCREIVNELFKALKAAIQNDYEIKITGFGRWFRKLIKGRTYCNFLTENEPKTVPDHYIYRFELSRTVFDGGEEGDNLDE